MSISLEKKKVIEWIENMTLADALYEGHDAYPHPLLESSFTKKDFLGLASQNAKTMKSKAINFVIFEPLPFGGMGAARLTK